ncbi:MAG TPA: c-type cytochrome [Candidatus Polarisedimenticolaceae bacterium]|nr:c-type cytochrome [Candidatus Polarisedimenticolaceae bacterium]
MTGSARALIVVLAIAVAAEAACLAFVFRKRAWLENVADRPVQRGEALARQMGCFGCHGPGGASPIPNPGAKGGEVPGWVGGTWMMYCRDPSDLKSWILDGHPVGRAPDSGALIAMPAYRSRLTSRETGDLLAFVLSASQCDAIDDATAAAGHETAYRLGCFGCHGPEGRGLVLNPGSFKGFIPPWDGEDYADLVRDDAEFAQWVRTGMSDRFRANPAARAFLSAQAIKMPGFEDRIKDDEMKQLAAYVTWIRAHPR